MSQSLSKGVQWSGAWQRRTLTPWNHIGSWISLEHCKHLMLLSTLFQNKLRHRLITAAIKWTYNDIKIRKSPSTMFVLVLIAISFYEICKRSKYRRCTATVRRYLIHQIQIWHPILGSKIQLFQSRNMMSSNNSAAGDAESCHCHCPAYQTWTENTVIADKRHQNLAIEKASSMLWLLINSHLKCHIYYEVVGV